MWPTASWYPPTLDDGVVVAVVEAGAAGLTVERAATTNREIHPHLHLDGVEVPTESLLVGGDPARGTEVMSFLLARAWTGLCALQVGVTEAAVAQTAEYLNTREQFGRPLSTFQGTMLRAADAAIDTEAIRVTMWQAAWRLDHGLDAELAVSVASWFAAEAGQRAVYATQHLHGGMGADISYPIHRYFLWGKQIELLLGSPSGQLATAGRPAGGRAAGRKAGAGMSAASEVAGAAYTRTLDFDQVSVGDDLPELVIPLTRTLIVSTAMASRDFQDVHHDPVLAAERGSKDIFMNILSTNGLVGRYVTDWSGPAAVLTDVKIRLGAPNYPDDTMTMSGSVTAKDDQVGPDGRGGVEVAIRGANSLGDHVTGTVRLTLPSSSSGGSAR